LRRRRRKTDHSSAEHLFPGLVRSFALVSASCRGLKPSQHR